MKRPAPIPRERNPISTLENGVFRLVGMYFDDRFTSEEYSLARSIIADVFWITEKHLDDLVQKECNILYPTNPPRRNVWGQL